MLRGSEAAIDSQMLRAYYSRQGNGSRDASWKVDMGNPGTIGFLSIKDGKVEARIEQLEGKNTAGVLMTRSSKY